MRFIILSFYSALLLTACQTKSFTSATDRTLEKAPDQILQTFLMPRPVYRTDVQKMNYSPSVAQIENGDLVVAFEQMAPFAVYPIKSQIFYVQSTDGINFSTPKQAFDVKNCFFMDPNFLKINEKLFLYADCFNFKLKEAALMRSEWLDARFSFPNALKIADSERLQYRHHTFPAQFSSDKFAATYELRSDVGAGVATDPTARLQKNHLKLAYSEDGRTFGASQDFGVGVMIRTANFSNGTQVITYQNALVDEMMNFIRLSRDSKNWTEAQPISSQKDMHDSIPFRRADGGIDLYYISSGGEKNFIIYRRTVSSEGTYGPIEQLTKSSDGSFTQPHPFRKSDGSIFLAMTKEIVNQTAYEIWSMQLAGDSARTP